MSKFKKDTEGNSKICIFWMLPAKVSGHQVRPGWPGQGHQAGWAPERWVGTGQRGVSSFDNQGLKNDSNISLLRLKPLKFWSAPSRGGEEQGRDFTPSHCTCRCMWEMNDRTRGAPGCSSGISRREMWLLSLQWPSAAHRTGPSPGWINFSLVPSIFLPVDPPGLLLLLWASSRFQPAKHSVGELQEDHTAINTSSYHRRHSWGVQNQGCWLGFPTRKLSWGDGDKQYQARVAVLSLRGGQRAPTKEPQRAPSSEEWQSGSHVVLLLWSHLCPASPCKANCFHLQPSGIKAV